MSYDLKNHILTNSGSENGYDIEMWEPANGDAKQEVVIRVSGKGQVVEDTTNMFHENRFGIDVEDFAAADAKVTEILQALANKE